MCFNLWDILSYALLKIMFALILVSIMIFLTLYPPIQVMMMRHHDGGIILLQSLHWKNKWQYPSSFSLSAQLRPLSLWRCLSQMSSASCSRWSSNYSVHFSVVFMCLGMSVIISHWFFLVRLIFLSLPFLSRRLRSVILICNEIFNLTMRNGIINCLFQLHTIVHIMAIVPVVAPILVGFAPPRVQFHWRWRGKNSPVFNLIKDFSHWLGQGVNVLYWGKSLFQSLFHEEFSLPSRLKYSFSDPLS